jgi:hypothetical protein
MYFHERIDDFQEFCYNRLVVAVRNSANRAGIAPVNGRQ